MSKQKLTPELLGIAIKMDEETDRLRNIILLFKKKEEEIQIKLDVKSACALNESLTDLIHDDKMKDECEGYRIID